MASKHIVIIQGHPDPEDNCFCHALAKAYLTGAESSGHHIKSYRPREAGGLAAVGSPKD